MKFCKSIKVDQNENCFPLPSLSRKIYKFKSNITLDKLVGKIKKNDEYEINSQILNYNGKIIAINVTGKSNSGNIPCLPSSPLLDIPYAWLDDIPTYFYNDIKNF